MIDALAIAFTSLLVLFVAIRAASLEIGARTPERLAQDDWADVDGD